MTRASSERETTFRYAADEDHVSIFTAHTPTARKLERIGYAPYKVSTQGNEPVGWFFRVPINEFQWRAGNRKKREGRPLTSEQVERLRAARRQAAQKPSVA
jgi:hypothetical protein